jgi:O-antigen/teichoic acid export membrane protein
MQNAVSKGIARFLRGTGGLASNLQFFSKLPLQMNSLETDNKFLKKSMLFNIVGTILKSVGPLLAILTARIFGKEAFGIFVSTQLWILTLSRVSVFGLDKGLHWFLPQNSAQNRPQYFGYNESIYHSMTVALIFIILLVFCSYFELHKYSDSLALLSQTEIIIYALSLLPWVMLHIFGGSSEGMRKPQYKIFITDCSVGAIAPLLAIIFHFLHVKYAFPLGLLCANILGCIFYQPFLKKIFPNAPGIFSIKLFSILQKNKIPKELLLYSLPRGFSEVIASILYRIDLWLVFLMLGPSSAGVYSIMLTISNAIRTVANSFGPILLPVVAGMNKDRLQTDLKPTFSYCVEMTAIIQLIVGFFIILFPAEILSIAGKSFVLQPEALGILLFANLLSGLFGMVLVVINGMGKSLYTLKIDILSLVAAFIANYFLIPKFGLVGAAFSTLSFTLVQIIWNNIYLFKMGFFLYTKKILKYIALSMLFLVLYSTSPYKIFDIWQRVILYLAILPFLIIIWRKRI